MMMIQWLEFLAIVAGCLLLLIAGYVKGRIDQQRRVK